jgi:PAS domain S-box-containing protein
MTADVIGVLEIAVVVQAATIVALLIHQVRRGHAYRALRESESRFRLVADRAPVILWTARTDTRLDFINGFSVEFSGIPLEQLLDEGWLRFIHPHDVEPSIGLYGPAFEARRPFTFEFRLRRADGAYRWMLSSGIPKYGADGSFDGYIGCSIDITERKEAEDRVLENSAVLEASHRTIRQLAGRLIEAQDAERARIARDLHDDVSQQIAGMSIAFSGLKRRIGTSVVDDELQENLRAFQQRTIALAEHVRLLSHDLHPTVLQQAGLVAALTAYCAELERAHGTLLTCRAEGNCGAIDPATALCLYRVAQEALRNVTAHAGAASADVRLARIGDIAELTVTDDGKGFDVGGFAQGGKGLGLVSITERVRLAGGTVSIVSEVTKGTRVAVQIPAGSRAAIDSGTGNAAAGRE